MVAKKPPDKDCLRFGLRLVSLRERLDWTQEILSLESGMSQSHLSGIENGRRNLGLRTICRLARAMGVKEYALMDLDGEL